MRKAWAAVLFLSMAAGAQEGKKPGRPANVGGLDQEEGAVVTGIVRFAGPQPERKPVNGFAGNAFCAAACDGKAPLDEKWIFGKNGDAATLQNVFVYVSKGLEGKKFAAPKDRAILDQEKCMYRPRVLGVMTGQTLEIRNSDATLHNVNANFQVNKSFNVGMGSKDDKLEKVFENPEMKVDVRCNMHQWMLAWVHVLPHPYFAVTGADGTFTLKGLPPGEYEITVIHESSRFSVSPGPKASVKVGSGETKQVEFTYQDGK